MILLIRWSGIKYNCNFYILFKKTNSPIEKIRERFPWAAEPGGGALGHWGTVTPIAPFKLEGGPMAK